MLTSYGSLAPRIFLSYERDSWKGEGELSLRLTLDRDILWRAEALDLRRARGAKRCWNRIRYSWRSKYPMQRPAVAGRGPLGKRDFPDLVFQMRQSL